MRPGGEISAGTSTSKLHPGCRRGVLVYKKSEDWKQRHRTVLSIDGGGMRGMIPARVLERLEKAIQEVIIENLNNDDFKARFDVELPADYTNGFQVDLADYFDVMGGTSTGSIVAAYLATKGANSGALFENDRFKKRIQEFKDKRDIGDLRPGSAQAAQALFAAAGPTIFGRPWWAFWKWPILAPVMQLICRGYGAHGIELVLKDVFGGDDQGIKLSAAASAGGAAPRVESDSSTAGALHTSLIIPAFQITKNRGVVFWHRSADALSPAKPAKWGYSTLNRLRAKDTLAATQLLRKHAMVLEENGNTVHITNVDFPLWRLIRASTAAPTFFPPADVFDLVPEADKPERQPILTGKFADGGVVANNPMLAAVAFLAELYERKDPAPKAAVLSLGCGSYIGSIKVGLFTGQLAWVLPLVNILMGAGVETVTALGEELLMRSVPAIKGYLRVQAVAFEKDVITALDAALQPIISEGFDEAAAAANMSTENAAGKSNFVAFVAEEQDTWTSQPKQFMAAAKRGFARFNKGKTMMPPNQQITEAQLVETLKNMDKPQDWQNLLEVGDRLCAHYENDLKAWVKSYVLGLPVDAATGAATTSTAT